MERKERFAKLHLNKGNLCSGLDFPTVYTQSVQQLISKRILVKLLEVSVNCQQNKKQALKVLQLNRKRISKLTIRDFNGSHPMVFLNLLPSLKALRHISFNFKKELWTRSGARSLFQRTPLLRTLGSQPKSIDKISKPYAYHSYQSRIRNVETIHVTTLHKNKMMFHIPNFQRLINYPYLRTLHLTISLTNLEKFRSVVQGVKSFHLLENLFLTFHDQRLQKTDKLLYDLISGIASLGALRNWSLNNLSGEEDMDFFYEALKDYEDPLPKLERLSFGGFFRVKSRDLIPVLKRLKLKTLIIHWPDDDVLRLARDCLTLDTLKVFHLTLITNGDEETLFLPSTFTKISELSLNCRFMAQENYKSIFNFHAPQLQSVRLKTLRSAGLMILESLNEFPSVTHLELHDLVIDKKMTGLHPKALVNLPSKFPNLRNLRCSLIIMDNHQTLFGPEFLELRTFTLRVLCHEQHLEELAQLLQNMPKLRSLRLKLTVGCHTKKKQQGSAGRQLCKVISSIRELLDLRFSYLDTRQQVGNHSIRSPMITLQGLLMSQKKIMSFIKFHPPNETGNGKIVLTSQTSFESFGRK